jgi:hypothetical protein
VGLIASSDYEEYRLLGWDVMQFGRSPPMFHRNVLPPSSGVESKPSKKPARSKIKEVCPFETSVDFYQTKWRYIPEYIIY